MAVVGELDDDARVSSMMILLSVGEGLDEKEEDMGGRMDEGMGPASSSSTMSSSVVESGAGGGMAEDRWVSPKSSDEG